MSSPWSSIPSFQRSICAVLWVHEYYVANTFDDKAFGISLFGNSGALFIAAQKSIQQAIWFEAKPGYVADNLLFLSLVSLIVLATTVRSLIALEDSLS